MEKIGPPRRTIVCHWLTGKEMEAKTARAIFAKEEIDGWPYGGCVFLDDGGELLYMQPYIPLVISGSDGDESFYYDEEIH